MDTSETTNHNVDCLAVLGVHRSGISALAGCLHLLGVNLGSSLLTGNVPGKAGSFINQDIVLVHDILFRDLGCRWDMVGSLPEGWVESEAAAQAGRQLIKILERQFAGHGPWAVTDPRLCRLMPLWSKVFETMDTKPCFVHMVRHPDEVACSLNERDGMDLFKGHLLWLTHNRDALQAYNGHDHVVLTYDQLLADPVSCLSSIAASLNYALPRDPLQYARPLTEFARPDHKHHHSNVSAEKSPDKSFAQYAWVYDQFRANQVQAGESHPAPAHAVMPKWRNDQGFSDFPLVPSQDTTPQVKTARSHTVEMFNNLLEVIGRYEQAQLDQAIERERRLLSATHMAETIYAQIYFPIAGRPPDEYTEENSHKILLAPGEWQQVILDIPRPDLLRTRRLRLDPLNTRGMVCISNIKLIHSVTGAICWAAQDQAQFAVCSVEGDGLTLSLENGLEMICTGNDARLRLPLLPDLPDAPMHLQIWIKASRRQTLLHDHWSELNSSNSRLTDRLEKESAHLAQTRQHIQSLEGRLGDTQSTLQAKEIQWQAQFDELNKTNERAEKELAHQQALWQIKSKEHASLLNAEQQQTIVLREKAQMLEHQLQSNHAALQTQQDQWQSQRSEQQTRITTLEKTIADLEKSKSGLEAQFNQLEDLSGQYYTELIQAERGQRRQAEQKETLEKHQALVQAKTHKLKQEIADYIHAIHDLKLRLKQQRALTRKYHAALAAAEADTVIFTRWKQEKKQLAAWIKQLDSDFHSLLSSRRWRIGNAVGRVIDIARLHSKKPLVVDHMQVIFDQFQKTHLSASPPSLSHTKDIQQVGEMLLGWMKHLQNDFKALMASRRWRIGNAAIRSAEVVLLRPRARMAPDYMQEIFAQYENWHQNKVAGSPESTLAHDEIKQLLTWMRDLNNNFQAMIASRRWRVGNASGRLFRRLLFRPKPQLAAECMQQIFNDYRVKFRVGD